jgi:hypothetical protein
MVKPRIGLVAAGPRDVWAVGGGGAVVHFDGRRWQKQDTGTGVGFSAVWGDAERVWIAGPNVVLSRARGHR